MACTSTADQTDQDLTEEIVLNALNIDLKLKNLNNFVDALLEHQSRKRTAPTGETCAVKLHSFQDLGSINLQSKPLM